MLKEELTKQHLKEIALEIYRTLGSPVSILNLILCNPSDLFSASELLQEARVVEPKTFLQRLDSTIYGGRNHQSNLIEHASKIYNSLFITELIELPLFINDQVVKAVVIWRLRKGL